MSGPPGHPSRPWPRFLAAPPRWPPRTARLTAPARPRMAPGRLVQHLPHVLPAGVLSLAVVGERPTTNVVNCPVEHASEKLPVAPARRPSCPWPASRARGHCENAASPSLSQPTSSLSGNTCSVQPHRRQSASTQKKHACPTRAYDGTHAPVSGPAVDDGAEGRRTDSWRDQIFESAELARHSLRRPAWEIWQTPPFEASP